MVSSLLVSAVVVAVAVAEAISLQGRSILAKETEDIRIKFLRMDFCENNSKFQLSERASGTLGLFVLLSRWARPSDDPK